MNRRTNSALCLLAALAGSCAYGTSTALLTPHLKTVAIPVFENVTTEYALPQEVTDAVIARFVQDNHLRVVGSLPVAVERAKSAGLPVEVECETLGQVHEALAAGAEQILLDNMAPAQLREAVALVAGRAQLEASGGVTLETVRAIAETGVDFISVGALTHSAPSLDVSLEIL